MRDTRYLTLNMLNSLKDMFGSLKGAFSGNEKRQNGLLAVLLALSALQSLHTTGLLPFTGGGGSSDASAAATAKGTAATSALTEKVVGVTPLHVALRASDPAMVGMLLKAGADPCAKLASGESALHLAVLTGDTWILERVLEAVATKDGGCSVDEPAEMPWLWWWRFNTTTPSTLVLARP